MAGSDNDDQRSGIPSDRRYYTMYIPVQGFRLEEAVRRGKGLGFLEVEFLLLYENASRSGVFSRLATDWDGV
ncbi:hypothetical protein M404DRAFT_995689 [Pisolithus tinctorius Marx 270]|uniref:Uncharacterized protein n=1 Tax=Pisolithus tinctorius Marx 270 TaxID=870435 RepID=A0A0C3PNQ2_PISTI|nr:hypothetical protein M404DRAFT_995689 [Pisolithus tinctorius Marx 270]